MTNDAKEILAAASRLPVGQRIDMIRELTDSVERELPATLTPEQAAEVQRRLEHARAHPETLRPAEDVMAEVWEMIRAHSKENQTA